MDHLKTRNLTIAHVSEQAAESQHKHHRSTRKEGARRTDPESNLLDTFKKSSECSDPMISSVHSLARWKQSKRDSLPQELLEMLEQPNSDFIPEIIMEASMEKDISDDESMDPLIWENSEEDENHIDQNDPFSVFMYDELHDFEEN